MDSGLKGLPELCQFEDITVEVLELVGWQFHPDVVL